MQEQTSGVVAQEAVQEPAAPASKPEFSQKQGGSAPEGEPAPRQEPPIPHKVWEISRKRAEAEARQKYQRQTERNFGANGPELAAQQQELEAFRAERRQRVFERDLAAIRKEYPDEKAATVDDLGADFLAIMAAGKVDALAAYEAVRAQRARQAPQPPSMGDVKGAGGPEKGWFSRRDVQQMSPGEVRRNFEAIRRSMGRW